MCGFVFSSSAQTSKAFKQSFDHIFHRGPDHQAVIYADDATWGFHRLSIMDLSSQGNQPFNMKAFP